MKITEKKINTILKVKSHEQKKAQIKLSRLLTDKEKEEKQYELLGKLKIGASNDLEKTTKYSANVFQSGKAYINTLTENIAEQMKKLENIQQKEVKVRDEILEKEKGKKKIELLSEKKIAENKKEQMRKDQRLMDILASRIQKRL